MPNPTSPLSENQPVFNEPPPATELAAIVQRLVDRIEELEDALVASTIELNQAKAVNGELKKDYDLVGYRLRRAQESVLTEESNYYSGEDLLNSSKDETVAALSKVGARFPERPPSPVDLGRRDQPAQDLKSELGNDAEAIDATTTAIEEALDYAEGLVVPVNPNVDVGAKDSAQEAEVGSLLQENVEIEEDVMKYFNAQTVDEPTKNF